jgi:hypothetical protein
MAERNFHRILVRFENSEDAAIAECDLLADARVAIEAPLNRFGLRDPEAEAGHRRT